MSLTTNELAAQLCIAPQTLRAALCRSGSYFGIRPAKLPGGRLLWPDDTLTRLTNSGPTPERSETAKRAAAASVAVRRAKAVA